jgi:hypothetical protein
MSIWWDVVIPSIASTALLLVNRSSDVHIKQVESAIHIRDAGQLAPIDTNLETIGDVQSIQPIPKDALVVLEGTVQTINGASIGTDANVQCVIYHSHAVRHLSKFSTFWGEWTEEAVEIGSVERSLPFFIADQSGNPLVAVPQLNQFPSSLQLQQVSSTFSPASHASSLPQLARDYVNGERTLGFQISESGITVGSHIIAIGQLDYNRVIEASASAKGFTSWWKHATAGAHSVPTLIKPRDISKPFILTTQTLDEYLGESRQWAKLTKYLASLSACVAVLMVARRTYLYYMDQRVRARIAAMRARRKSFVSRRSLDSMDAPAENVEHDEHGEIPEAEICVICLEARRGVVLMPCGHFVTCTACTAQLADTCPVCREYITSKVKVFG